MKAQSLSPCPVLLGYFLPVPSQWAFYFCISHATAALMKLPSKTCICGWCFWCKMPFAKQLSQVEPWLSKAGLVSTQIMCYCFGEGVIYFLKMNPWFLNKWGLADDVSVCILLWQLGIKLANFRHICQRILADKKFIQISESLALVHKTDIQISASLKEGRRGRWTVLLDPRESTQDALTTGKALFSSCPLLASDNQPQNRESQETRQHNFYCSQKYLFLAQEI